MESFLVRMLTEPAFVEADRAIHNAVHAYAQAMLDAVPRHHDL